MMNKKYLEDIIPKVDKPVQLSAYKLKSNDILSFYHVGDYINVFGETIYKLVCDKEWSSLTLSYAERSDCVYIELKGYENRHE